MKNIAIIPLRAGSKGILGKNKKRLLGRPLFSWVLTEAIFSRLDKVYIYTDDEEILSFVKENYSWTEKVEGRRRSDESASDTASTEQAMIEFAEGIGFDFDHICLLQATSPFTTREDINKAIDMQMEGTYDSLLSVVESRRFIWNEEGKSMNYDFQKRPRRQDFKGDLVENGAIYFTSKAQFMESKNRISGRIGLIKMAADAMVEIDETEDFLIAENLLANRMLRSKNGFKKIDHLFLDVDGVFTDASLAVSREGEFSKSFSVRDGMGIGMLRESGVEISVVTSENSEAVAQRMKKLGIDQTYLGIKDKFAFLEHLVFAKKLDRQGSAYMGDDLNDLANILACGLGCCPLDAEPVIKMYSDVVLTQRGGERVIRELCEYLLKYNRRF